MAVMNLVREEMNIASALFEAMVQEPLRALAPRGGRAAHRNCCDIPPPCWMPQPLGAFATDTSQCGAASLDVTVTNGGPHPQTLTVEVTGTGAGAVTMQPSSLTLPPLQRGSFTLTVNAPKSGVNATLVDVLVLIRGCRSYYLYWTVGPGNGGRCACHRIAVDDGPDLIHHWYDHFYCQRRCPNPGGVK